MLKDKKELFFKSFFAFIVICIVVSILVMALNSKEDFSFKMGRYESFDTDWYCENTNQFFDCPNKIQGINAGEELIITKSLPDSMAGINCLEFRTFQGACKVYVDDELREEYDDIAYRRFSQFPPSVTILVDLSMADAGKTVKIVYICENKNYIGTAGSVVVGEKDAIVRKMLYKYAPTLIVAVLLVLFGIICVVVFWLLYRQAQKNTYIVYLGIFLAMIGLWMFASSRMRQLFFGDITTLQYLELWLIHILPIPMIFFCDLRCNGRYHKVSNIVLAVCYLDFIVTNILHFTGIVDKAYSLTSGHILCAITALYFIVCNVLDYRLGYKKEATQIVVSFSFLIAFSIVDVVKLYLDRQWTIGVFIAVGVLCFSVVILAFSVQDYIAYSEERMSIVAESEAKEQFFASMSHDIRTPINAIIGMNEMIQRDSKDDSALEYSRDIQRASETLMSIVNNILDFSKMRDVKYEIVNGEYLFAPMIADVIKMTTPLAEKKELEFAVTIDENIPSGVVGDENALKRVLTNLLSNAIKYTKEGKVELIATVIGASTDIVNGVCIHFEITDTGMGIKKEDIPHIFDVFSRMDGHKNKHIQGTGLGLAITKSLVTNMGSEIKVSSVYGEGSVFSFDLNMPVYNSEPIGHFSLESAKIMDAENSEDEESGKSELFFDDTKTILIVDDTYINLKVMTKLLQINGVKVVTAGSGDECINLALANRYDMILLDDMMPEKDGRETLTELKNSHSETITDVPIIALTANAGPGVKDMYLSLGFTDYMSKPVKPDVINQMLWTYLGEK